MRSIAAFLAVILSFSVRISAAEKPGTSAAGQAQFDGLVESYFDLYFRFHPTAGTSAGFHQYDSQLEDFSRDGVAAEVSAWKAFLPQLEAVDASTLDTISAGDFAFLHSQIQSRLFELETVRSWEKDPDPYASGPAYSIYLLMKRNFAPPEERLRSVVSREKQIPSTLSAARHNLSDPPRVFTEVALEQLPGTIDFFRKDIAEAFRTVTDPKLRSEFEASNRAAVEALQKYQNFLEQDLLPISKGDFRLGAENFRKKLLYDEMVDIPLDRLREIGYADLHRNQEQLKQTAGQIDPQHGVRQVMANLQNDHPAPDRLLQSFRDVLFSLRQFIEAHKIVTLPSQAEPVVEETPPFARALTTAAMETPGPYETRDTKGIFQVTLPEPGWKPEQIEEWMREFPRGTIVSTSVHEVYPGHFVQYLWSLKAPSKVRKLLYCNSNAEGWAHYSEQMMLDEGYSNDPRIRLGQIQDALLRDARFVVGIEMHTGKMTLAEAEKFFVEEGYQVPPIAKVEARRGTSDPTYLVYTLGKLQIMKLRADYQQAKGVKFNLQEFHDRFLEQGGLPIKLIRQAMLGDDGTTL